LGEFSSAGTRRGAAPLPGNPRPVLGHGRLPRPRDPIARDQDPYPIMIPSDDDWENTRIWEPPLPKLKPHPPPDINTDDDAPPF
jgi:hypothetical protein